MKNIGASSLILQQFTVAIFEPNSVSSVVWNFKSNPLIIRSYARKQKDFWNITQPKTTVLQLFLSGCYFCHYEVEQDWRVKARPLRDILWHNSKLLPIYNLSRKFPNDSSCRCNGNEKLSHCWDSSLYDKFSYSGRSASANHNRKFVTIMI